MNTTEARGVVVGGLLVTATLVGVTDLAHGKLPASRQLVGWVGAGFVLSLTADVAPALAAGLTGLLVVSTILTVGSNAFDVIARATQPAG